jgi:hypothetical protein
MNRILVYGVAGFFAIMVIALVQNENTAVAGHGKHHKCHGCSGCDGCFGCHGCHGCFGCHGCHGCFGCDGCHGCYGGPVPIGKVGPIQHGHIQGPIQHGPIQHGGGKVVPSGGGNSGEIVPAAPDTAANDDTSTFALRNQGDVRTWTDNTGVYQVEASFLSFADGRVKLQRASTGATMSVPLNRLSESDQQIVLRFASR